MDPSVFQTDAVKVDSIARLLRQADDMLSEVKGHLHDYGERLSVHGESSAAVKSCQLEIEQLKQAICEKEESSRVARFERVQALEDQRTLRDTIAQLEARLGEAEITRNQLVASTVEDRTDAEDQKELLRVTALENERLRKESDTLKRRLDRALEQNERLLRTREELLDTLKLSDVVVRSLPQSSADSARICLVEAPEGLRS